MATILIWKVGQKDLVDQLGQDHGGQSQELARFVLRLVERERRRLLGHPQREKEDKRYMCH